MPIKIADGLAAKEKLHDEGIFTIDKGLALHQDIRPLHILILNLMPLKKPTELQLLRLLGDSPLQSSRLLPYKDASKHPYRCVVPG